MPEKYLTGLGHVESVGRAVWMNTRRTGGMLSETIWNAWGRVDKRSQEDLGVDLRNFSLVREKKIVLPT